MLSVIPDEIAADRREIFHLLLRELAEDRAFAISIELEVFHAADVKHHGLLRASRRFARREVAVQPLVAVARSAYVLEVLLLLDLIRIVARQAVRIFLEVAAHAVDDGRVKGREDIFRRLRQQLFRPLREIAEVNHVREARVTRVAAEILGLLRLAAIAREEFLRVGLRDFERFVAHLLIRGTQLRQLREVRDGERRLVLRAGVLAAFHVRVADDLREHERIAADAFVEAVDDARVVPAVARLEFLRCDEVAAIAFERVRHAVRRHEAAVEADDVKWRLFRVLVVGARERVLHLVQLHHVAGAFIVASAEDRAAAVIPYDEDAVIRCIVVIRIVQEIGERVRRCHVGIFLVLNFPQAVLVVDKAVDFLALDVLVLPFLRAARLDDECHAFRRFLLRELREVIRRRAVFGLEVRAADVHLDDPGARRLLAETLDFSVASRRALVIAAAGERQQQEHHAEHGRQGFPQSSAPPAQTMSFHRIHLLPLSFLCENYLFHNHTAWKHDETSPNLHQNWMLTNLKYQFKY